MHLEFSDILALLISIIAISVAIYSTWCSKLHFSGIVWGIRIQPTAKQRAFMIRHKIFMVLGYIAVAISAPFCFMAILKLLFTNFTGLLIYIAIWFGCAFLFGFIASKRSEHSPLLEKEHNTAILGNLPFIQRVEAQLMNATYFIVSFEGIALVDRMNYCYALERYENYRMGSLSTPNEVAMVGMYFVQKYHHLFDFTVDMERIPGTPGQTITIVGSSGVNYAFTKGTPDQQIFRSYIFTRK